MRTQDLNSYSRKIGRIKSNELYLGFSKDDGTSVLLDCMPRKSAKKGRPITTGLRAKVSGDKYVGLQQDTFVINLYNLPGRELANLVNDGYRSVVVYVKDIYQKDDPLIPVFTGQMINVTGGRPDFITYEIKITAVRRASIFLNSMVDPTIPESSMNFYDLIKNLIPATTRTDIPQELKDLKVGDTEIQLSGDIKNVLDSIIKLINERVGDYAWFDITYTPEGIINIFDSQNTHIKVFEVTGPTGLIGVPTIDANGINFQHVYQEWVHPGAVVKLDNSYLNTTSSDTAFLFTMDPEGEYVITHVKYTFEVMNGLNFTCECEAFPRSKYLNWTSK